MRYYKIFTVALLLAFSIAAKGEGRYVVIAEAVIPSLNDSANSVSKFADKVSPGSSMIVAGGVIALTLQLRYVNITSDLRILIYGDSTGKDLSPRLAFIVKPSSHKIPSRIKFNKYKFPVKKIGDRLFVAETKDLINDISALPSSLDSDADISVRFYPQRYFTACGGSLAAFKAKIEKEFSKGRKNRKVVEDSRMKSVEKILKQCKTVDLFFNAASENLKLSLDVTPAPKTGLYAAFKKHQGTLQPEEVTDIAKEVAGDNNIKVTKQMESAISFILKRVFSKADTDSMASQICKLAISSDDGVMHFDLDVTSQQMRNVLITAKVIHGRKSE